MESTTNNRGDLYSLWSIQDSLLQSYRAIFVTAQSIVMSLAASIAASKPTLGAVLPLVALGIVLMVVWLSVTQSRSRSVTFSQKLIFWAEKGKAVAEPFATFKEYQNNGATNGAFTVRFSDGSEEIFRPKTIREQTRPVHKTWKWGTRIQMEGVVPGAFMICWAWIFIYVLRVS